MPSRLSFFVKTQGKRRTRERKRERWKRETNRRQRRQRPRRRRDYSCNNTVLSVRVCSRSYRALPAPVCLCSVCIREDLSVARACVCMCAQVIRIQKWIKRPSQLFGLCIVSTCGSPDSRVNRSLWNCLMFINELGRKTYVDRADQLIGRSTETNETIDREKKNV